MVEENINDILNKSKSLIKNSNNLLDEIKEMDNCKNFLLNEYKTNKRWFREEPGKVTIEDIIKASFDFGWSCKRNFDYDRTR